MPIIEARENLQNDLIFTNDQDRVKVVTQKINLKSGMQRNMLQMDLFWDTLPQQIGVTGSPPFDGVIEVIVTPTPLILTAMSVDGLPSAGPNASNDNVLFKAIYSDATPFGPGEKTIRGEPLIQRQFPQSFLATQANFAFYHPHVYVNLVFHLAEQDSYPYVSRSRCSFYMSFSEKKISALKYGLGLIREFSVSQIERVNSTGRLLSNPLNLAGQYSPLYTWGGARPEIMISGQNLTQYFLSQSGQEAETMNTSGQLRTFAEQSRTMVPNPEAFGDAAAGIPYWIRDLLPMGVISGAVRPQRPPRVTQDDPLVAGLGNVICV